MQKITSSVLQVSSIALQPAELTPAAKQEVVAPKQPEAPVAAEAQQQASQQPAVQPAVETPINVQQEQVSQPAAAIATKEVAAAQQEAPAQEATNKRASLQGWEEYFDAERDRNYYFNPATQEVSWYHPRDNPDLQQNGRVPNEQ